VCRKTPLLARTAHWWQKGVCKSNASGSGQTFRPAKTMQPSDGKDAACHSSLMSLSTLFLRTFWTDSVEARYYRDRTKRLGRLYGGMWIAIQGQEVVGSGDSLRALDNAPTCALKIYVPVPPQPGPTRKSWMPLFPDETHQATMPSPAVEANYRHWLDNGDSIAREHRDRWVVIHDGRVLCSERFQDTLWQQRDAIPADSVVLYVDESGHARPPTVGAIRESQP